VRSAEDLVALRDVYLSRLRITEGVSDDYGYRKICREYSKKFATPLMEVYALPVEHVLQAFYEEMYEDMEDKQLREEVRSAVMTDKELEEAQRREDMYDAEAWRDSEKEKKAAKAISKIEDLVSQMKEALPLLKRSRTAGAETQMVNARLPEPVQEGFSIRFEDVDLDQEGDFGLLDDPAPKR